MTSTELRTRPSPGVIDEAGRIAIPAEVREALGLHAGDKLTVRVTDGEIRLFTLDTAVKRAQAMTRKYVPVRRSLVDELIAERHAEAEREQRGS